MNILLKVNEKYNCNSYNFLLINMDDQNSKIELTLE